MPEAKDNAVKVVATGDTAHPDWMTRAALREAVLEADIVDSGFQAVYLVESDQDPEELARRVVAACGDRIGHVSALVGQTTTGYDEIRRAAIRAAERSIGPDDSFAFRVHKRGTHDLDRDTPEIEKTIGGAIWESLEKRHGREPRVDLDDPDVAVFAEVFGSETYIGIWRKAWRQPDDREGDETGNDPAPA